MALLTPAEFAQRCGVSERTIRQDMYEGLPYLRVPPVLIPEEQATRWREQNRRPRREQVNTCVVT